jgi:hypothetical protein
MADKVAAKKASKDKAEQKIGKGDAYLCEICGLQLHVDLCGEFLASKGLSCCGNAMKKKATK